MDFVIGPIAYIASRLSVLDFSYPTYMTFYQLLIPSPELTTNFGAPWRPFSLNVEYLLSLIMHLLHFQRVKGVDYFVSINTCDDCDNMLHQQTIFSGKYHSRSRWTSLWWCKTIDKLYCSSTSGSRYYPQQFKFKYFQLNKWM